MDLTSSALFFWTAMLFGSLGKPDKDMFDLDKENAKGMI